MAVYKINRRQIGLATLRSFLLQGSWNFERMQSLGALAVLAPGLRTLYRGEALAQAFRRHLTYFNTHPFMAGLVLGTVLRLEEKESRGEESYLGAVEFKEMIMAPYAAIGDALFWGGLRPLAAVVALFFAAKEIVWAPAVFLVLFNIPHLLFRFAGFPAGYFRGLKTIDFIQRRHLPDLAIRMKEAALVLLGVLGAYLVYLGLGREHVTVGWGLAVPPAILILTWLARKGVSSLLLIFSVATLVMALGQLV